MTSAHIQALALPKNLSLAADAGETKSVCHPDATWMADLPGGEGIDLPKKGLKQSTILIAKSWNVPYPFSYPSSHPVIVHSRDACILLQSIWLHQGQDTAHTGVLVWDAMGIPDFLSCLFFLCNDPPRDAQGALRLPASRSVNSLLTRLSSASNHKGNVPSSWQGNRLEHAIPILQSCVELDSEAQNSLVSNRP